MSATDWLGHVVVADAGTTPATRYAGWLFVQNGATVVDRPSPDGSGQVTAAARDFLDTGKLGPQTRLSQVDVLLRDAGTLASATAELPPPRLVGVTSDFDQSGPRAGWVGDELVTAALGGAAGYTRSRSGEPVYGFGYRYQYLAGLYLFTALVAELSSGTRASGKEVAVSVFETVASLLPYPTTQYAYNGSDSILEQSGPRFVVACRDGWVVVYAGLAWPAIVGLCGRPELLEDPRFVELGERFRHVRELGELFDAWGARLSVAEALAEAAVHDVAASVVRSPRAVLDDPDLQARGAFREVRGGGLAPSIPHLVVSEGLSA
jgi:crotonobetainyl-CoA:carnitine CoA-transferase CaiB-like acyl-CoA transferase